MSKARHPSDASEAVRDLPPGLAKPALRALQAAGYTQLAQLTQVTEADLRQLHGMGPKAIGTLREALQARGQSFASPPPQVHSSSNPR